MKLELKKPSRQELVLLHDSYWASDEPDAPQCDFASLSAQEQASALIPFNPDYHWSAYDGDSIIGFVGVYPDGEFDDVGVFYTILPTWRSKGYFSPLLKALVRHCRQQHPDYKFIRALTRLKNLPSIKGLTNEGFVRKGEIAQRVTYPVFYEEYLLQI